MVNIPESMVGSLALQLAQSQGWQFKVNVPNLELEICPYCHKTGGGHFYLEAHGTQEEPEQRKRDGLHICHKCSKGGSLYSLKQHLKLVIPGVSSGSDWAEKKTEPMPDIEKMHQDLLEDIDTLDYLVNERKLGRTTIEKYKLGISTRYFKSCGTVKCLAFPYLIGNNPIFIHFKTLPPAPKDFNSLTGWDSTLFNGQIIQHGLKELLLFEGEMDTLIALDNGIEACGVPGANFKKADWIKTIEDLEIEKIYICYDTDKVGTRAAQTLATRIGIEKCYKIVLPPVQIETDDGPRRIKDINEWFQHGGTKEDFLKLKESAQLFDVDGVTSSQDAMQELEDMINGREGLAPKYNTPWPSLNKLVGFDDGYVIDIYGEAKRGKTTAGMNLVEYEVDTYGEDGCIICLEMQTIHLARKWVSHVAGVEDNIPKTPEEAIKLKEEFLKAIPYAKSKAANREGNLYFCYPSYAKIDDLYKIIIEIIRRYGVKWIMFDNIQLACDTTLGGKNRTQHLSEISKTLAKITKDYNIKMIRIVQPHQIKPGQMATAEDADGSSQISKDCDCTIVIHRSKANEISAKDFETLDYVESESSFSNNMLVTVGLSRYSAGGYTTLKMDGARSTITEYNESEVAKFKQEVNNVGHNATLRQLGATVQEIQI